MPMLPAKLLPYSIKVVQKILVLLVWVRILVGQHEVAIFSSPLFFMPEREPFNTANRSFGAF